MLKISKTIAVLPKAPCFCELAVKNLKLSAKKIQTLYYSLHACQ